MATYETIIGLEVHAELNTKTKMFCDSLNDPNEKHPNINICPVCMGHPGTLPVINEEAVKKVIQIGLALKGEIPEFSQFDRKNYFYPDLPKGYQISQYEHPLVKGGYLDIEIRNPKSEILNNVQNSNNQNMKKQIRVTRIHLEEDAGRLLHDQKTGESLVDFNRAGRPLMELVTEPDLRSGEEVRLFGEKLQRILRYVGASNADMEKGELRVEVNISLSNSPQMAPNESRIMLKDESYGMMKLLFEIHNKLGPIYKEKNYQDAVEEILKREGIPYEREKNIKLKFENIEVSNFYADFVIRDRILLEIKAKPFITNDDVRQGSRYIKSLHLPLAIVANFKRNKLEYKRVVNPAFENDSSLFEDNSRRTLGTKVEVKNINSFKFAEDAVNYEIKRQTEILERGGNIIQETRGWNERMGESVSQRSKEESHDYRYFPEPDLPPLNISKEFVQKLAASLPELPGLKKTRFIEEYGLDEKTAELIVREKDFANYFENVVSELREWESASPSPNKKPIFKLAANFMTGDFLKLLHETSAPVSETLITPENFGEFLTYVAEEKISSTAAKAVFDEMFRLGGDPSEIIKAKNLMQISDETEIESVAKKVIDENPKPVADYKNGAENVLQFLVGQVMKASKGKANPKIVKEIMQKLLKDRP